MDKNIIDGRNWEFPEGDDYVDSKLVEKEFTENGVYNGPDEGDGTRGYSKVRVNVSSTPSVLVEKTLTENGEYYAINDNANGYSKVTVNINQQGIMSFTTRVDNRPMKKVSLNSTINLNGMTLISTIEEVS